MNKTIETVGVIIFDNKLENVLLVKHLPKAEHQSDKYGIPAGRLNDNESLVVNAIRELKEESGLTTTQDALTKLPFAYEADIPRKDGTVKHFRLQTFLCSKYAGELRGDDENEPIWVKVSDLSKLNLLPNMHKVIQDSLDYI